MTGLELIVGLGLGAANLILIVFGSMIIRRLNALEKDVNIYIVATEHRLTKLESIQKQIQLSNRSQ